MIFRYRHFSIIYISSLSLDCSQPSAGMAWMRPWGSDTIYFKVFSVFRFAICVLWGPIFHLCIKTRRQQGTTDQKPLKTIEIPWKLMKPNHKSRVTIKIALRKTMKTNKLFRISVNFFIVFQLIFGFPFEENNFFIRCTSATFLPCKKLKHLGTYPKHCLDSTKETDHFSKQIHASS